MKKTYINPSVEMTQMTMSTIVMAGSAKGIGAGTGSGTTGDIGGGSEPIPGS